MKELLGLKNQFPGALLVAGGTNAGLFVRFFFTFVFQLMQFGLCYDYQVIALTYKNYVKENFQVYQCL